MILRILSNTPVWVWGLLAGLIALGLTQLRTRTLPLARAFVLPAVMCALALAGTLTTLDGAFGVPLAAWLLGVALVGGLLARGPVPAGTCHDAARGTVTVPGSSVPLLLILGIFTLKYALGVAFALQPELAAARGFGGFAASLYGALAGLFVGRAGRLFRFTRGRAAVAPSSGLGARLAWVIGSSLLGAVMLLAGAVAFGTSPPPPPLALIAQAVAGAPAPDLPALQTFAARDGTPLAYRAYPAAANEVVVLIHGSAGDSHALHAVGRALASAGITAYALDLRGHGASGRRGDIDYVGQLEDDLADFLQVLARRHPGARRTLLGHSSGGGFTLRVAGGPLGDAFDRYVMLAPLIHPQAPTTRPNAGGWVQVHLLRLLALRLLDRLGLPVFQDLPVLAFALPPTAARQATLAYSYRLQLNFRPHEDFRADVRGMTRPGLVLVGADDALFVADAYAPLLSPLQPRLAVRVLPDVDHLTLVSEPGALAAIVAAVKLPQPVRQTDAVPAPSARPPVPTPQPEPRHAP